MGNKSFVNSPFAKLKKQMDRTQTSLPAAPPRQKKKEEYSDAELFSTAMDDVLEIEEFRTLSCSKQHPPQAAASGRRSEDRESLAILDEIAGGQRPIHLPDTQEYISWVAPNYAERIVIDLHNGHFAVQAFVDLHGFSVPDAEAEVELFLHEAFRKGLTCVKIIHGRGLRSVKGPRLKDAVVRRLLGHFRKDMIAYTSARQCDGGLGALYVLLRRK
jgi:DNA-nicking Smr family endonuclease